MAELSVLVPARNEQFLPNTVQDLVAQMRGDTEIIVVLDGAWPEVALPQHPKVHIIYRPESIGQRAATNEAARISTAKFIMKADAHCRFDEGFDVKLMADCERDWTVIPRMYNLHAFSWQCDKCGHTDNSAMYQGPKPGTTSSKVRECPKCQQTSDAYSQRLVWEPRWSRKSDFARFDSELHFQYWGDYGKRPEAQGEIADVMSSVGACWFMRRDRYWELGGLDEGHGSWGQMGTEIACKTWLSGGRQVVNKKTWFSHMFRTQPGFSFPYAMSDGQVQAARRYSQAMWRGNAWPQQRRPLSWLLEKFWPVPGWSEETYNAILASGRSFVTVGAVEPPPSPYVPPAPVRPVARAPLPAAPTKGLVYYSDLRLDPAIASAVQRQLQAAAHGAPIVSVTLTPLAFGENHVLPLERGHLTMFKQILAGLEALTTDVAFLVEHDVLYHPSHFDFTPTRGDVYYYNQNTWKVDAQTGRAVFYFCNQTSGLCASRTLLVEHYRARVARVEREGFTRAMGFEPGTHRPPRGIDDYPHEVRMSAYPNIDIRHTANLTQSRWSPEQFRNKKFCQGWTEADAVPGWGVTKGRFAAFLAEAVSQEAACPQ